MTKTVKDLVVIALFVVASTIFIWLPHILALPNFWGLNFSQGFAIIYRNFDGLEYIIIAKTFYKPELITPLPQSLPAIYFASHFPGFSILISIFAPILGFLKSMLFISLVSTIFSVWAFYFLVKNFKLSPHPLFLSLLFLMLPARWLVVHSVGASEPTFIFFVITSIYFFMKAVSQPLPAINYIWLSVIFAAAAQLTRPPGILLAIAVGVYILWQSYIRGSFTYLLRFLPFSMVPLTLLGIFYLYGQTYGDFFAYFHSGDNIHLTFPPFQVFNKHQFWVGDIWLEDIVYIFILGLLGGMLLIKQKLYPLAFFVLTYLTASIFVVHRDISRYILPITPFVLIAFEKVLTSKEFKIILPFILLAIYLYAQNFILANVAPIPNLETFN